MAHKYSDACVCKQCNSAWTQALLAALPPMRPKKGRK